jgi:glycogen operon protein
MAKNVFTLLLLSQGVPMLLAGDEVLKSQSGNNNGYCQDNDLTWFDWSLVEKNAGMLRFVKQLIALRKRHPSLMRRRFLNGQLIEGRDIADIDWHGEEGRAPDWDDPESRILGFTLAATDDAEADLHVTFNTSDTAAIINLPDFFDRRWQLAVNTGQASPADIQAPAQQRPYMQKQFSILPHAAMIFESYRLDA